MHAASFWLNGLQKSAISFPKFGQKAPSGAACETMSQEHQARPFRSQPGHVTRESIRLVIIYFSNLLLKYVFSNQMCIPRSRKISKLDIEHVVVCATDGIAFEDRTARDDMMQASRVVLPVARLESKLYHLQCAGWQASCMRQLEARDSGAATLTP